MHDDTKISFWSEGSANLAEGLEERQSEIAELELRIAESRNDAERARLEARLEAARTEYAPSEAAQERSFF